MKVENIKSSPSFGVNIDKKLVKDANRYYRARILPDQIEKFNKTVEKLRNCGSRKTTILHHQMDNENGKIHMLCLKNTSLNNQKALLLTQSDKYNEILRYFSELTCKTVEAMEEILAAN